MYSGVPCQGLVWLSNEPGNGTLSVLEPKDIMSAGDVRALNGPRDGNPCTVQSVPAHYMYRHTRTRPIFSCRQRKPSCTLLACPLDIVHSCTQAPYLCARCTRRRHPLQCFFIGEKLKLNNYVVLNPTATDFGTIFCLPYVLLA